MPGWRGTILFYFSIKWSSISTGVIGIELSRNYFEVDGLLEPHVVRISRLFYVLSELDVHQVRILWDFYPPRGLSPSETNNQQSLKKQKKQNEGSLEMQVVILLSILSFENAAGLLLSSTPREFRARRGTGSSLLSSASATSNDDRYPSHPPPPPPFVPKPRHAFQERIRNSQLHFFNSLKMP